MSGDRRRPYVRRRAIALACEGCRRILTEARVVSREECSLWLEGMHHHGVDRALVVCCGVCCVKVRAIALRETLGSADGRRVLTMVPGGP